MTTETVFQEMDVVAFEQLRLATFALVLALGLEFFLVEMELSTVEKHETMETQ